MKNTKKTTLFIDIGGVLLSNGWGHEFRQKAVEKFNLNKVDFEAKHKIMYVTYEEDKITLDEYLERVIFYKKQDFTKADFRNYMFSLSTPHQEMIDFIKKLKQDNGLKIVAVSNEARDLNDYRIKTFGLDTFIDFFVSSCYIHLRKPDPKIFKMALDLAQVSSHDVIYIDDVQTFTDIASDSGIKSIHHIDWLTTSKTLATFGLQTKPENLNNA